VVLRRQHVLQTAAAALTLAGCERLDCDRALQPLRLASLLTFISLPQQQTRVSRNAPSKLGGDDDEDMPMIGEGITAEQRTTDEAMRKLDTVYLRDLQLQVRRGGVARLMAVRLMPMDRRGGGGLGAAAERTPLRLQPALDPD
jgi:hypothetical protein